VSADEPTKAVGVSVTTTMRKITVLIFAATATASAQTIPIRTIGPILATSTENVGQAVTVRGTSDGHVIVGAGQRQKVYAFDSTLKNFTMVVDSGAGTGVLPIRTTGLTRTACVANKLRHPVSAHNRPALSSPPTPFCHGVSPPPRPAR